MIDEAQIVEISKRLGVSVEKILDELSKPSLTNTPCNFDDKSGVGSSDLL